MHSVAKVLISIIFAIGAYQFYDTLHEFDRIPKFNESRVDLSASLKLWKSFGKVITVRDWNVFVVDLNIAIGKAETLVFMHGYPSSSHDFNQAYNFLAYKYRIILFDFIGFGFSDKPAEGFSYSIIDHADVALQVLSSLQIQKGVHFISHDMGDSVLTELIARSMFDSFPKSLPSNLIKSVTFSNGGMIYDQINFRMGQIILSSKYGYAWSALYNFIPLKQRFLILKRQLASIWGMSGGVNIDRIVMEEAIADIFASNRIKEGLKISHLLIRYLNDRKQLETRWLNSLKTLTVPSNVIWGKGDEVSPISIPKTLVQKYLPKNHVFSIIATGHFPMLENPSLFYKAIDNFVSSL